MMSGTSLQRATLAVAILTSFSTPFMGAGVNLALPRIGAELGLDAVMLSWIATSYLMAAAVFLLPFGRLADIRGRKRVFSFGVLIFLAGSAWAALARSGTLLIVGRVVQGFGGGMVFSTATAMLISVFPPGQRGRVLGWNIAAVYLGLALGPPIGGWIVGAWGWRTIFGINALLCALALLLTWRYLDREWREAAGECFDWRGAALYALTVIALMYGLSALPGRQGYLALTASLIGLFFFLRWEALGAFPLMDVRLLRDNRVFALSNLAALINYGATFAVGFILSLYLQYVQGLEPRQAGLVMMSQPVMQALFSPLAGYLSDRYEPRLIASAGMALSSIGLAMLATVTAATPLLFIGASLFLLGIGFGLFSSPNTNAIMGSVERRHYGLASAMVSTMRMLGQMFSMGMAAMVIALYVGHTQITLQNQGQFLGAMHLLLGGFAALCFAGIFASLARGRMHA